MAEWLTAGASLLGAAGGLFGGGGGSGGRTSQSFNQTTTSSPWSGISPYLTGGTMPDGTPVPGIFPEAGRLYNKTGWTPGMEGVRADWFNDTFNNRAIGTGSGYQNVGGDVLKGQYDPRVSAAGPIAGPGAINPFLVDPTTARGNMGVLDPTNALTRFMDPTAANPFVTQAGNAITGQLTRNMQENVMPGIRSGAILSGQYGGNKDAQAEGLAVSRLNQDLAPALASLGLTSWENAQNRGNTTALALNQTATNIANANADRDLQAKTITANNLLDTQKFNTGTTLANNTQEIQRAGQTVQNRGAGLNFLNTAQGMTDNYSKDLLKTLNGGNDFDWANLGRYASVIQPSAELFKTTTTSGTSSGTQPMYGGSPISSAIGGGLSGLALSRELFGPNGPFGGGGGGGGGGGMTTLSPEQTMAIYRNLPPEFQWGGGGPA